jgi:hypothetical protein
VLIFPARLGRLFICFAMAMSRSFIQPRARSNLL